MILNNIQCATHFNEWHSNISHEFQNILVNEQSFLYLIYLLLRLSCYNPFYGLILINE